MGEAVKQPEMHPDEKESLDKVREAYRAYLHAAVLHYMLFGRGIPFDTNRKKRTKRSKK